MNLKHLNLDLHHVHGEEQMQIAIVLIAAELQSQKLISGLTAIGCDACFCVPDLSDLVLAFLGFDERPNKLYERYFELLDKHRDKVTRENRVPVKEAIEIFKELQLARQEKQFS